MTSIDWSDPEEMLGLLIEYVADEAQATRSDPERRAFLRALSRELEELADSSRVSEALRELIDAQSEDFARDPVTAHLEDCLAELERIDATQARG